MDYRFLILSLLTILVATTKFSISIQPYEKTCFYEILRKKSFIQNHNKNIQLMSFPEAMETMKLKSTI